MPIAHGKRKKNKDLLRTRHICPQQIVMARTQMGLQQPVA